jgi:hypothetical protein
MTDTAIPTKDTDDTCSDSLCCQTKKNMCEQHPSTTLRANCSRIPVPESERQAHEQP